MTTRIDFIAPARWPFFYGWVVAVASTLGVLASIPGQTMGVSVFTDALLGATGLSRLSVSNAYLAGTLMSALTLPLAGSLVDRFGVRPTGFIASIGLAAVLAYLSQIDRLGAALGVLDQPWAIVALLTGGFFGLRLMGQGLLTMTSRTMVGRWFQARRGMVAGLSGIVIGFGFGSTPQLFDLWIQAATWRGAWLQMALLIGVGMGLTVLLFFRDRPEDHGLQMDGGLSESGSAAEPRPSADPEPDLTRAEALGTLAFWAVTLALAVQALMITGITFHIVDIAKTAGLDRQDAVQIFLPMALVSIVAAVVGGTLGDRLPVRALLVAMMIGLSMGMLGAVNLADRKWLAIVGLGISGGLFSPASTIAYPRFFGRLHLGAIVGAEMMALVIASAIGPSWLALSRANFGSYGPALNVSLVLPVLAVGLALTFRAPRPPSVRPVA